MLRFGSLADNQLAHKIVSDLKKNGIPAFIERNIEKAHYDLFVEDEQHLAAAFDCFRVYMGVPKPLELDPEWQQIQSIPSGFMTKIIIYTCIALFLLSYTKYSPMIQKILFFGSNLTPDYKEIYSGEVWRLITPIFLHFGFLHIFFNMMWMKDLGNLIENKFGVKFYLMFILFVGVFSNITQYQINGPRFGGMSGVIYGILGLLWMYNKFYPEFKLNLPKKDIVLMLGWFVACLVGMVPHVANMAHAGGLTIGMLLGIIMGVYKGQSRDYKNILLYSSIGLFITYITFYIESNKLI
jgi:GlpG protein